MKTVLLQSSTGEARWEATVDGCLVEVVQTLMAAGHEHIERSELPSPRLAEEFVAQQIEHLIGQGFVPCEDEDILQDDPLAHALEEIAALVPMRADHPEMFADLRTRGDGARLVYADWLMERSDPLGLLIALQHAARGDPHLNRAVDALLSKCREALVPPAVERLTWRLGFVDAMVADNDRRLPETLRHRASALVQQLCCSAEPLAGSPIELPTVHTLILRDVRTDLPLQKLVSKAPTLRHVGLCFDSAYEVTQEVFAALPPGLAVVAVRIERVNRDSAPIQAIAAGISALPIPRPALFFHCPNEPERDAIRDMLRDRLQLTFHVPGDGLVWQAFLNDGYAGEGDLLDRICPHCGNVDHMPEAENCGVCGGPIAIYDEDFEEWTYDNPDAPEDDGLDEDGEFCTYDAARDPDFDAEAKNDGTEEMGVASVDRRWESLNKDAFDLDDSSNASRRAPASSPAASRRTPAL